MRFRALNLAFEDLEITFSLQSYLLNRISGRPERQVRSALGVLGNKSS